MEKFPTIYLSGEGFLPTKLLSRLLNFEESRFLTCLVVHSLRGTEDIHNLVMSSAYKSLERKQKDLDSSSEEEDVSEESSETLRRESQSPEKVPKDVPAVLKNRTLMLTSRGVSHRYVGFTQT